MSKETEFMNVQAPDVFATRSLAELTSVALRREKMSLSELELEKLHQINAVLNDPELLRLIGENNEKKENMITLAMIKPMANESKDLSADDQTAADLIAEEIGIEHVVFSLSLKLSPKDIEIFYAGNPHVEDIKKHFAKGAATFMLLYFADGNAVGNWRDEIGPTIPDESDTIRGKHALSVKNNLVHGSDSVEAVKREIGILRAITVEMEEKSIKTSETFPHESCIKDLVLNPDEELMALEKVCSMRNSLPGFVAIIRSHDGNGIQRRLLKARQLAKAS